MTASERIRDARAKSERTFTRLEVEYAVMRTVVDAVDNPLNHDQANQIVAAVMARLDAKGADPVADEPASN